jgi:NADH-quinone oxidoreductase subunit L
VQPYLRTSRLLAKDPMDRLLGAVPRIVRSAHKALKVTENGYLRWYAASMAGGAVLVLGIIVLG